MSFAKMEREQNPWVGWGWFGQSGSVGISKEVSKKQHPPPPSPIQVLTLLTKKHRSGREPEHHLNDH